MRNKLISGFLFVIVVLIVIQACQSEEQLNYARYYVNGKNLYEQHCQNCHSSDGQGLGELYPALTDTVFLKSNKNRLACFIKYGLKDSIVINGKIYEGQMPSEPDLAEIEIAALVTYVTNSFGNKQGFYDVNNANKDLKSCNK
jgi:mono/diheme cytochrome c family protein